jgi:hypothetical protein
MYRVLDAFLGAEPRDWSADLLEISRRATERSAAQRREIEASRVRNTRPSLPADRFAGRYASDLFGEMRFEREGNRLVLYYAPDYVADLEHWHHDTFRAVWRRPGFGSAFVTFALDARASAGGASGGSSGAKTSASSGAARLAKPEPARSI